MDVCTYICVCIYLYVYVYRTHTYVCMYLPIYDRYLLPFKVSSDCTPDKVIHALTIVTDNCLDKVLTPLPIQFTKIRIEHAFFLITLKNEKIDKIEI